MKVDEKFLGKNLLRNKGDILIGRNAVKEAILSGREINSILLAAGSKQGALGGIFRLAKEQKIPVKEVNAKKLELLCDTTTHQGIIAMVAAHKHATVDEILDVAKQKNESPFIIILDGIPY